MSQRQIHVVAAQHQVLSDGRTRQRGQAAVSRCIHADQCQIGSSPAHIHHQHQPAVHQLRGQLIALQHQPVVKRGLGLLQQLHARQTRHLRGLQRQRTCTFVK